MRADRILACLDELDDEAFNFAVSRLDMDTVTAEELRALRDEALRRADVALGTARALADECYRKNGVAHMAAYRTEVVADA